MRVGDILKNGLLVIGALLFVAVAGELFLRVAGYRMVTFYPFSGFYQYDAELGWRGKPNHVGRFDSPNFSVTVQSNALGFRDDAPRLDEGVRRIAVLGDSFTWGWGVEQDEIFTAVAEREMEGVDVVNMGQNTYGTAQEYLLLKNELKALSPELVVIAFYNNDVADTYGQSDDKPVFRMEGNAPVLKSTPRPWPLSRKVKAWCNGNSLLFTLVDYRLAVLKQKLRKRDGGFGFPAYFKRIYSTDQEAAWELTLALLAEMNRLTDSRLLIMYLPDRVQVEEDFFREALAAGAGNEEDIDLAHPAKKLREFAGRNGIPFLDLTGKFRAEYEKMKRSFYFEHDVHWTKEGHRLAGIHLKEKVGELWKK